MQITRHQMDALERAQRRRFEKLPWAAPILQSPALDGGEQIDRLGAVSAFRVR